MQEGPGGDAVRLNRSAVLHIRRQAVGRNGNAVGKEPGVNDTEGSQTAVCRRIDVDKTRVARRDNMTVGLVPPHPEVRRRGHAGQCVVYRAVVIEFDVTPILGSVRISTNGRESGHTRVRAAREQRRSRSLPVGIGKHIRGSSAGAYNHAAVVCHRNAKGSGAASCGAWVGGRERAKGKSVCYALGCQGDGVAIRNLRQHAYRKHGKHELQNSSGSVHLKFSWFRVGELTARHDVSRLRRRQLSKSWGRKCLATSQNGNFYGGPDAMCCTQASKVRNLQGSGNESLNRR